MVITTDGSSGLTKLVMMFRDEIGNILELELSDLHHPHISTFHSYIFN